MHNFILVTARKRILGQGNMFTGVFLSTGAVPDPGGAWFGGMPGLGGCAWSRGVPGPGDCLVWGGAWSGGCLV